MQSNVRRAASSSAPSTGTSLKRSIGEITSTAIAAVNSFSTKGTRASRISGRV